jgi:hypothetical protein
MNTYLDIYFFCSFPVVGYWELVSDTEAVPSPPSPLTDDTNKAHLRLGTKERKKERKKKREKKIIYLSSLSHSQIFPFLLISGAVRCIPQPRTLLFWKLFPFPLFPFH